jgi:hypothetical protein
MKSVASLSAAAALLSGSANAFWRMPCHDRTALARLDPIVDRGVASAHAHTIHGGNSTYTQHLLVCSAGMMWPRCVRAHNINIYFGPVSNAKSNQSTRLPGFISNNQSKNMNC